jgi:glycine cleavage system H protein
VGGGIVTAGEVPADLRYSKSHEWMRRVAEEAVVGITDHAQAELTDVVFVDFPKVGAVATAGTSVLVIESVKTVADVYAPCSGTIVAVNEALRQHPELVNRAPYTDGWLFRIRVDPAAPVAPSLSPEEYVALLGSETPSA